MLLELEKRSDIAYKATTSKITDGDVMNCGSLQVIKCVTSHTLVVKMENSHRFLVPSDTLAVTSRQNVSHRCFLPKTLSVSTSGLAADVSGPEEEPYAWA